MNAPSAEVAVHKTSRTHGSLLEQFKQRVPELTGMTIPGASTAYHWLGHEVSLCTCSRCRASRGTNRHSAMPALFSLCLSHPGLEIHVAVLCLGGLLKSQHCSINAQMGVSLCAALCRALHGTRMLCLRMCKKASGGPPQPPAVLEGIGGGTFCVSCEPYTQVSVTKVSMAR